MENRLKWSDILAGLEDEITIHFKGTWKIPEFVKKQIYGWKITLGSQKLIFNLQHQDNSEDKFKDKGQENKLTSRRKSV